MLRTVALGGLLLISFSACSAPTSDTPTNHALGQLSISGVGKVRAVTDQVIINMQITADRASLSQAKAQADAAYQRLLDALDALTIEPSALTLNHLQMNPKYEWQRDGSSNKQVQVGFTVSRSLALELNDTDKLGSVLERIANDDQIQVNGINRALQNPDELMHQAMALAAKDATSKAQFLAKQFDRTLGKAITISVGNSHQPIPRPMVAERLSSLMATDAPPQEQLGEQVVSATVAVVFELK